jgi:parallel beta-helix repeat protein
VIEHNHYRGIDLWSVSESTIAHNEILDNGGDWNGNGIFDQAADDMNGNGVTDGDGVTLCYVDHLKVKHNKIHGSYEVGLSINQCTDSKFAHNDVSNNLNLGIALFAWGFPTTRNVLLHNNASDNLSSGISLYTGSDDNKVENNHCNNNGLHGIDVRSDSNTLLENHCDENAYSGIRLRTGSDNNMVKKNHCNQNVQYGIRVSGDYNTFEMNHAKNNVISNYLDEGSGNVWIKNK